jgi:RES domain-containing protein
MTVSLWRIATDTPTYRADDLHGAGAKITGGRWNRPGTPLVYAAESIALAALETVVHLTGGQALPLNRILVRIDVPDDQWAARAAFDRTAGVGWDVEPPGIVSMEWGDAWAASCATLLAEVPSVVVPESSNLLINPLHAALPSLRVTRLRRWTYDGRLRGG